jgi:hypothetical protein
MSKLLDRYAVASVTLGEHEDFGFDAGMCEASTWSMFSSFSTRYCSCNIEENKLTAWKTRKDYDENKAAAKVEVLSVATLIVKEKAKAEGEMITLSITDERGKTFQFKGVDNALLPQLHRLAERSSYLDARPSEDNADGIEGGIQIHDYFQAAPSAASLAPLQTGTSNLDFTSTMQLTFEEVAAAVDEARAVQPLPMLIAEEGHHSDDDIDSPRPTFTGAVSAVGGVGQGEGVYGAGEAQKTSMLSTVDIGVGMQYKSVNTLSTTQMTFEAAAAIYSDIKSATDPEADLPIHSTVDLAGMVPVSSSTTYMTFEEVRELVGVAEDEEMRTTNDLNVGIEDEEMRATDQMIRDAEQEAAGAAAAVEGWALHRTGRGVVIALALEGGAIRQKMNTDGVSAKDQALFCIHETPMQSQVNLPAVIQDSLSRGVGRSNSGDTEGCTRIYRETCLQQRKQDSRFEYALELAGDPGIDARSGWFYRAAFDSVVGGRGSQRGADKLSHMEKEGAFTKAKKLEQQAPGRTQSITTSDVAQYQGEAPQAEVAQYQGGDSAPAAKPAAEGFIAGTQKDKKLKAEEEAAAAAAAAAAKQAEEEAAAAAAAKQAEEEAAAAAAAKQA